MGTFRANGMYFVVIFHEQYFAILQALNFRLDLVKVVDSREGRDILEFVFLGHDG